MKYYKIVQGREIVGVINTYSFFAENYGKLSTSNEELGQFVEYNGKLYRDSWMQPIPRNRRAFEQATINQIEETEFFAYLKALRTDQQIVIEEEEEEEPEEVVKKPEVIETLDEMLEYIRASKISEMSHTCRKTIENGFDIELRGENRHFSLDTQDQLNLISLGGMAATQELIPYHADGEACIFYTAEEINNIVAAATSFKVYHTTYYNALKNYINALETIEEISSITYGTPIPKDYQSEVLKVILNEN